MSEGNGNKTTSAGVIDAITQEGLTERERAALTAQELQAIRDEHERFAAANEVALKRVEERFSAKVDTAVDRIIRSNESQHTKTRESLEELKAQVTAGQIRDAEHELAREGDATRRKLLESELDDLRAQLIKAEAAQRQLAADVKVIDARTTGTFPVPPLPPGLPRPLEPRSSLPSYEDLVDSTVKQAHEQAKINAAIAAKAADIGLEGKRTDIQVTAENRRLTGKAIAGLFAVPVVVALIGLAGMLLQRSCNTSPPDKHIPVIDSPEHKP